MLHRAGDGRLNAPSSRFRRRRCDQSARTGDEDGVADEATVIPADQGTGEAASPLSPSRFKKVTNGALGLGLNRRANVRRSPSWSGLTSGGAWTASRPTSGEQNWYPLGRGVDALIAAQGQARRGR